MKKIAHILLIASLLLLGCEKPKFSEQQPDTEIDPEPAVLNPEDEEQINATVEELAKRTMPAVSISTKNAAPITSNEIYVEGEVSFSDPDGRYTSIQKNGGEMRIRERGNSSRKMPKKQYRIKLAEKQRVFGMPENKDWVLIANYCDKSLMRNLVAMEVSRRLGMSWTPRMLPCRVYVNDSYQGIYLLAEHKEVAKAKVNINPAGESELYGDYYLEIETALDDHVYIDMEFFRLQFKEPENPTSQQISYIKSYFSNLNSLIKDGSYETYSTYMDIDSFVNFFILQEAAKNVDGNMRKSSFMVKHKSGKLEMYHVWDFDLAYGNADYITSDNPNTTGPEGWYVRTYGYMGHNKTWYLHMCDNPSFRAKVKTRWQEVYPSLKDVANYIDNQYLLHKDWADCNFQKWNILNTYVWPNVFVSGTYKQHVDYMRKFYLDRLEWMNSQIATW